MRMFACLLICAAAQAQTELQLLHFSDIDGGGDLTTVPKYFSALLSKFRGDVTDTVVLSSGDNWIPGPEYELAADSRMAGVLGKESQGRFHAALLTKMGVQAAALGNHECDQGLSAVARIVQPDEAWPGVPFPYLSANVDFSTDAATKDLYDTTGTAEYSALAGKFAKSTVITTASGEKIGVVGATTPTLKNIAGAGLSSDLVVTPAPGSSVDDLAAVLQPTVDALIASGINKIIAVMHMQEITVEEQLAEKLKGVDVIVAGGSDTLLADADDVLHPNDVAKGEYPLKKTSASGEPVYVVNTPNDYLYLGRLRVQFDAQGVVQGVVGGTAENGAYASNAAALTRLGMADVNTSAIPDVVALCDQMSAVLNEVAGKVVGRTDVFLSGAKTHVRYEETNLAQLSAKADMMAAQRVEPDVLLHLKNAGGVRAPIGACILPPGETDASKVECKPPAAIPGVKAAGVVSMLELQITLKFNNGISTLTVTVQQLKELLEAGVSGVGPGKRPGAFPQVAGIRFSFDARLKAQVVNETGDRPVVQTAGERVRSVVLLDSNGANEGGSEVVLVENGVVVPGLEGRKLRMSASSYIAAGRDAYPFPSADASDMKDLGGQGPAGRFTEDVSITERDALAEYLGAYHPADGSLPAFNKAETPVTQDIHTQNLEQRQDVVIQNDAVLLTSMAATPAPTTATPSAPAPTTTTPSAPAPTVVVTSSDDDTTQDMVIGFGVATIVLLLLNAALLFLRTSQQPSASRNAPDA
eukprot:TRINITY_DN712_c0_g1_i1.p1 TRINITY_DN712_c0_g1~~TRINITY_DN712_c0_g1_i1.p1  ORF type:complete len:755 (+),score=253.81 TRINITY_DN712_c0_g1_i1:76-2340(+)